MEERKSPSATRACSRRPGRRAPMLRRWPPGARDGMRRRADGVRARGALSPAAEGRARGAQVGRRRGAAGAKMGAPMPGSRRCSRAKPRGRAAGACGSRIRGHVTRAIVDASECVQRSSEQRLVKRTSLKAVVRWRYRPLPVIQTFGKRTSLRTAAFRYANIRVSTPAGQSRMTERGRWQPRSNSLTL
jgi:hypothetical protein